MTGDSPAGPDRDRLRDLLVDRAVHGLTPDEEDELAALIARAPHADPDALDEAAAALGVALDPAPPRLPDRLRDRIAAAAPAHLPGPRPVWRSAAATAAAAVAGGLIAAGVMAGVTAGRRAAEPGPDVAEIRAGLAADPAAVRFHAPDGAEVVWHPAKQAGVLEVRGLPGNDPAAARYQIWVVDGRRAEPLNRVDGGLFDVPPAGAALVTVRATLPVGDAQAFAVTREVPSGVIVSAGPLLKVYARAP